MPDSGWPEEGTTYYAKFEYNRTSLTIVKSFVKNGADAYKDIDPNQTFIFDIYDGTTLVTTVTVHSATGWKVTIDGLTVNKKYTITEKTDWSWRYDFDSWEFVTGGDIDATGSNNGATITLGATGNVITFTNERSNPYWLDGDSWCDNIFDGPAVQNVNN
jgi:hypothetical protein